MGKVVYVKKSTAVHVGNGVRMLARGDAWDSDSDVVKEHREIFEDEPHRVAGRGGVERATRAPGEQRAPSAAEKKAAAAAKRKVTIEAKKAAEKAKADAAAEKSAAETKPED
jgi:hypothetical protein